MKKHLLSLLGCGVLALGTSAYAQQTKVQVYTLEDDPELSEELAGAYVSGVSANGQFATGTSEEYSDYSFIWSRATGRYTLIGGALDDKTLAYGVANDGTVVGVYADDNDGEVASGKTPYWIPGVYKDGKWTALELAVPKAKGDVNGQALWVSGDGRIVTGFINDYFTRSFDDDGDGITDRTKEVKLYRPAVWIDGKLQPRWENYPSADDVLQGCFSTGNSSEDGKVLAGYMEHPTGSRAPAVWVDGEMRLLYGQHDIDIDLDSYFFSGQCSSVSPNGKYVGGYFAPEGDDGYSPSIGFVHDIENNTTTELDNCGLVYYTFNDGTAVGSSGYLGACTFYKDGEATGISEYLTKNYAEPEGGTLPLAVMSASADGRVMAGYYVDMSDMGAIMYPSIVCVEGDDTGIHSTTAAHEGITMRYGVVMADGAESIAIYDTTGRQLGQATTSAISLGAHRGTVVARATYADGTVSTAKLLAR